ncbi:MAG: hypothetical protein E7004_00445 [Alphaproteobacteria bacterium]|nr:hypothetical protein [Alphaproteobacteria bacterium]
MEKKQTSGIKHKVVTWGLTFLSLFGGAKLSAQENAQPQSKQPTMEQVVDSTLTEQYAMYDIGTPKRDNMYKEQPGDSKALKKLKAKTRILYNSVKSRKTELDKRLATLNLFKSQHPELATDSVVSVADMSDDHKTLIALEGEHAVALIMYNSALEKLNEVDAELLKQQLKSAIRNDKDSVDMYKGYMEEWLEYQEEIKEKQGELNELKTSKYDSEITVTGDAGQNKPGVDKNSEVASNNVTAVNTGLTYITQIKEFQLKQAGLPGDSAYLSDAIERNKLEIEWRNKVLKKIKHGKKGKGANPMQQVGDSTKTSKPTSPAGLNPTSKPKTFEEVIAELAKLDPNAQTDTLPGNVEKTTYTLTTKEGEKFDVVVLKQDGTKRVTFGDKSTEYGADGQPKTDGKKGKVPDISKFFLNERGGK